MITTNFKDYQLQVPRFLLVLALPALGLLGIALGISSAIEKPYIGVWLDGESKSGWVIREIDEDRVTLLEHVNDGVSYRTGSVNVPDLLMVDDVIVAIHGLDKVIPWQFSPLDPDTLATYAEYNDFFKVQGELFEILKSGKVGLEKANGGIVWLQVFPDRPLTSLPFVFWSNCVFALAALIIGSLVSSYGLHTVSVRLTLFTSIGYYITLATNCIYTTRELAFPGEEFFLITSINHIGALFFAYNAFLVLMYYPKKITKLPLISISYTAWAFILISENQQWFEWPLHTFFLPYFFPFLLALMSILIQWRLNKNDAVGRASLLWLVITFVFISSLVVGLYFLPPLFGGESLINIWWASAIYFALYIGIVAGVIRFRLFQVETWWRYTWLWCLGGVSVLICDVTLVFFLQLNPNAALVISAFIVGWLWFPLRQFLLQRLLGVMGQVENFQLIIIQSLLSLRDYSDDNISEHWQRLLKRFFGLSEIEEFSGQVKSAEIENHGLALKSRVPLTKNYLVIKGKENGKRLFNNRDLEFLNFATDLAEEIIEIKVQNEEGKKQERKRIMRDLHDDVCPLLLTLIHKNKDQEMSGTAREALNLLRDTIYSLDDDRESDVFNLLHHLQNQLASRLHEVGIELRWSDYPKNSDQILSARQRINLIRVANEAISNIMKHGKAEEVTIEVQLEKQTLSFDIVSKSDVSSDPATWNPGTGMLSMETRIDELHGNIRWYRKTDANHVFFQVPLETS